jgi:hypothetical protein
MGMMLMEASFCFTPHLNATFQRYLTVIPAKAGIHGTSEAWIPAFAGMTTGRLLHFKNVTHISIAHRHPLPAGFPL